MTNALNWFEIPARDAGRARRFYETVLGVKLQEMKGMEGMTMYAWPWSETTLGGAVVEAKDYTPSKEGVVIYLNAGDSLAKPVGRVSKAGGKVLAPSIPIGENGFMAFILDTEGNRVGLHSANA